MSVFIDGFEEFEGETVATTAQLLGYAVSGNVSTAAGRTGGKALNMYNGGLVRSWTPAAATYAVGFAFMMGGRGGLVAIESGGETITVWADKDTGLINTSLGGEGWVLPIASRWYYMELVVDRTAKTMLVKVNGKTDITQSLSDTFCAGSEFTVRLNPAHAQTESGKNYDDFYIKDGDPFGPIQITTRLPTSAPTAEWTVYGAPSHPAAVGKFPTDRLNRFIQSGENGDRDLFTSSNALPNANTLKWVGLLALMRRSTSAPVSVSMSFGGQSLAVNDLTKNWGYRWAFFDPAGYDSASVVSESFGVTLHL